MNVEDFTLEVDYSVMDGSPEYKFPGVISASNYFEASANVTTDATINLSGTAGIVGSFAGGMDMSTIDNFFDQVDYIGAVPSGSTWTNGWARFQ